MSDMNEETRTFCPRCKSESIGPGQSICNTCANKPLSTPRAVKKEMAAGGGVGLGGYQLPVGVKGKKESFDRMIKESGDINQAQVVIFLKDLNENDAKIVVSELNAGHYSVVADMIRENIVRQAVRQKIREVVRKKAGGGGYVLYAPNKGKKKHAHSLGTFPTKLGAKRAELARFPPKDPGKLQRLRKEVEKLMKDPKKAAKAERSGRRKSASHHHGRGKKVRHYESKIISKIIVNEVKNRVLKEGLFREETQGSEWDEFIGKVSDRALEGDKGFQRMMAKLESELDKTLGQSLKIIQKSLGANAKVKSMGSKKHEDGRKYVAFKVQVDNADVGPIYVYSEHGVPRIELSDDAKSTFARVSPGAVTAIRGALSTAQDSLEKSGGLRDLLAQRDDYLGKLQAQADKMVSNMSPIQLAILKQLLVKKYRGTK